MKVLKVNIDEETDRKLRAYSYKKFGNKKGALSKTVEEALKMYLSFPKDGSNPIMDKNIEVYDQIKEKLALEAFGKFAGIKNGKYIGSFDSWEEAQEEIMSNAPIVAHGFIWQIGVKRKTRARIGWRIKFAE